MVINDTVKAVIESAGVLTLVTVCPDGSPYPIIAGSGKVDGDKIVFGIYKMDTTQKNLASNSNACIVAGTMEGGPKGYRLSGTAVAKEKEVIFTATKADSLI